MSQRNSLEEKRLSDLPTVSTRIIKAHTGNSARGAEVNEKFSLLGHMTAGIMHEIRGTCGRLYLAHNLLTQRFKKEEYSQMEDYLEAMRSGVEQLVVICNEGFSVIEGGSSRSTLVTAVERSVQGAKRTRSPGTGVEIETKVIIEDDVLDVNQYDVERMLFNLIDNAEQALLKASHTQRNMKKSITITVHNFGRNKDRELLDSGKKYVGVTVADNGPGMTEAVLNKIGKPFFTTNKNDGGTGLGVYITAHMISHMGGELMVSSGPDLGSRFTLCFPLH